MKTSRLVGLVMEELRGSRGAMAGALLSTVGVALADLARPWPLKIIFDQVLLGKPSGGRVEAIIASMGSPALAVVLLSAAIVAIAAVTGGLAYLQVHLTSRLGNLVVCRLRRELFAHIQRLSLSVHHKSRSGELLTRMSADTQALKDTFTESAITFGAQIITIAGCFAIMFTLSWPLTLIVLATVPMLFWNLFRLYRASRAAARQRRAQEETLTTQISEALSTASLIQAFGRERYETERFNRRSAEHLAHSIRTARLEAGSARTIELLGAAATALIVLFGALEVLAGRMTPGTVLVFSTYLHSLYRPIRHVAKLSIRVSNAAVSARRINDLLDIAPEIADAPDAVEAVNVRGEIGFERVAFAYPGGVPVLRDVSFRLRPGQTVALVGASGSGKSTIVSLLLRLYDPAAGQITIDGIDLRRYRRESLRQSIAIVLQEPLLLGASVRENIGYGRPDATDEQIQAATAAAGAHAFITRLPGGYDAILGERGATLSGGQRQRLALARAMVRDAPILVLDEPLTGLDRRSRARVQRAIERAAAGRTCILVTHDLETAAAADLVCVLHEGHIVAAGRPADLAARSELFQDLFRIGKPGEQASQAVAV